MYMMTLDLKVCQFTKTTKMNSLYSKGYNMAKSSFIVEVALNATIDYTVAIEKRENLLLT